MGTPIDITLANATPANQVFKPVGRQTPSGEFRFTDRTPVSGVTTANGWNHLTLGITPPTTQRRLARAKVSLAMQNPDFDPDGSDEGSAQSTMRFNGDIIIPDNISATNRGHFTATVRSFVNSDEFAALVSDLEGVF